MLSGDSNDVAMQLLRAIEDIFVRRGLGDRMWMRPYHILCVGPQAGLIEVRADETERVAAVAGSEFDLRLYDRRTLQPVGTAGAHARCGDAAGLMLMGREIWLNRQVYVCSTGA